MIALEVVFLLVFWTWVVTAVLFLRTTLLVPRVPLHRTPAEAGLLFETVTFRSTDGVQLGGWKIPADPSAPWIVCCHGVGSNRSDLLDIASGLHTAGFNLFLFDFRGHGGSTGRTTSFGWLERQDLEGALAFLGRQPDVAPTPYGVYGISMGGVVALMTAGKDERIGAIAVDSPYANLEATLGRHLQLLYSLPIVPFLWFILATYRIRFGVWPRFISSVNSIACLDLRPLLYIQGSQDVRTPPTDAEQMVRQARGPHELWMVEGANHLEAFQSNPQTYVDHLSKFFKSSLSNLK